MDSFLRFIAAQSPVATVVIPLFGALIVTLFGRKHSSMAWPVSLMALSFGLVSSIIALFHVLGVDGGEIRYRMGGWAPPFGIEYRIDALSALVVVAVVLVGLLNTVYAKTRVSDETPGKEPHYYTLYLLLIAGLCGITFTNDAFNLYVLIEITSLTSYALIAMGNRRAALSSFNYVIMGTIGASFYLLGVGYLYIKTGTLNMDGMHAYMMEHQIFGDRSITIAFILILLGIWIKMAFFPLHGWLPNAYAYAPTATATFMAPLMTKVMVYVMLRVMLFVFGADFAFVGHNWASVVEWLAVIAIVAGSLLALARTDIKKMLTFLIVAEVGYMVGGAWLGNAAGMVGTAYHILSDAAMTFCLFLAASIIVLRTGDHRLSAFTGLFRKMPITMVGFTIGALSMIGLPPTCGFFSKWYLIGAGIESGHYAYVVALLFSSLVNAIIFFRIFERAFFGEIEKEKFPKDGDAKPDLKLGRVPWSMLVPLLIAAALVLLVGIFNNPIATALRSAIPAF